MRVLVGMSGGVDSTAAAYLLKQQGYETVGVNLVLNGDSSSADNAENCADFLGMEFYTEDLSEEFAALVKRPFAESYMMGQTPNPCITCNREIKFGLMLKLLDKYNCEKLATGHYVNCEYSEEFGRYVLKKGADITKDQSYFLWELGKDTLAMTLFPIGNMTKPQVREIAEKAGLPCAKSPESQDVCFIPDGDCPKFIAEFTGKTMPCGNFVDATGKVLGEHKGITAYTVGQRRGLGISAEHPLYVLEKDGETNTVVLGKNEELFRTTVYLRDVKFISREKETYVEAKIRYSVNTYPGTLYLTDDGGILKFDSPQRAPTPGQSAVFYRGDTLLGGGIIVSAE